MLEITQSEIDPDGRVPHHVQIIFDDDGQPEAEAHANGHIAKGYVLLVGKNRPSLTEGNDAIIGKVHSRKKNGHLKYVIILIRI